MIKLGTLHRIEARTAWIHEAHAFTPWLAANISLLGEALGLDLETQATEVSVGEFSVDIVAKDLTTGRTLIIENQLEPTDHGHLGQLLTYAAGKDVAYVVWLAVKFRDDHRQALDWLNAHTVEGIDFFGVELELLQIDESPPAPHFKLVAEPNEWSKTVRQGTVGAPTELGLRYQQFFERVLAGFKEARPGITNASRVGPQNWFNFAAGRAGFAFGWSMISGGQLRAELFIDVGDKELNKRFFDALRAQTVAIEGAIGQPLVWERLDQRKSSRIGILRVVPTEPPFEANDDLTGWAADTMVQMTDVLRPIVKTLMPLPTTTPSQTQELVTPG
jgi:hypothetical protein